jgi:hypothetical protein
MNPLYPAPYRRRCEAPQPYGSELCGKYYEDYSGRRKYCSDRCRAAAHRQRHRPARRVAALERRLARVLTEAKRIGAELAQARQQL